LSNSANQVERMERQITNLDTLLHRLIIETAELHEKHEPIIDKPSLKVFRHAVRIFSALGTEHGLRSKYNQGELDAALLKLEEYHCPHKPLALSEAAVEYWLRH